MIKFFRRIRQQLLGEGKTGKYFKYALGEILLVMIGILLALQVNNWNESRKETSELKIIYQQVRADLAQDTLILNNLILYYENKEYRMKTVLQKRFPRINLDSPNQSEIDTFDLYSGDIGTFSVFRNRTRGFNLLQEFNQSYGSELDTLSSSIVGFYTYNQSGLAVLANEIKELVYKNIDFFEQYPWFIDWMNHRFNPEAYTYFSESEVYRKKVAKFNSLIINNYLVALRDYNIGAKDIITAIDNHNQ